MTIDRPGPAAPELAVHKKLELPFRYSDCPVFEPLPLGELAEMIEAAHLRRARRQARLARALLSRWVSGLEPSLAIRDGEIVGLCDAQAPLGSQPWIFQPFSEAELAAFHSEEGGAG